MRFPPTLQCPPRLRLLSSTMGLRTTDVATYREIVSPLSFPALRDVDNKDTARPITTTLCMHSLVCVCVRNWPCGQMFLLPQAVSPHFCV